MVEGEFYIVNVFTGPDSLGNPCAVAMVGDIDDTANLQRLAIDFNQPATTFLQQGKAGEMRIRWFAPEQEIDLCGHGTVAAIWVMTQVEQTHKKVKLSYKNGELQGMLHGDRVAMSGDAIALQKEPIPSHIEKGFNNKAIEYYSSSNKHLVLLENEEEVRNMKPDWDALRKSPIFGYVITAESEKADFVSRVLLPHIAKLEDQATGSAHLMLAPFWASRLNKTSLQAIQVSARRGEMDCQVIGDSVALIASCEVWAEGTLIDL